MCHHRARVRARVSGPGSRPRLARPGAVADDEEVDRSRESTASAHQLPPEQQALLPGDDVEVGEQHLQKISEKSDVEGEHGIGEAKGTTGWYTTSYSPVVHQCFFLFALFNLAMFGGLMALATYEELWASQPPHDRGWLKDTVIVYDDAEITTQHSRMTYFVYWLRSILMVWVLDYNGQPIKNKFWSQHMLEWYIVLVCLGLKAALLLLLFFWSGMTDPCTSCGCGHGKCMWTDPLSDEEDEDGMMGQMRAPLPRGLADSRGPSSIEHEKPAESTTGKIESWNLHLLPAQEEQNRIRRTNSNRNTPAGGTRTAFPTSSGDSGELLMVPNSAGSQKSSGSLEVQSQSSRRSRRLAKQLQNSRVLLDLRPKLPRDHGPNVNRARILSALLLVVCAASLGDHIILGVLYKLPKGELQGDVAGENGVKYHLPFMWLDLTVMFLTFVFLATTRWDRESDEDVGQEQELASLSDEINIRTEQRRGAHALKSGDDEHGRGLQGFAAHVEESAGRGGMEEDGVNEMNANLVPQSAVEAVLTSGTIITRPRSLTVERRGLQADYDVNAEMRAEAEHMASKTGRQPARRGCVRVVLADIFCAGSCTSVYCVVGLIFLTVVAIPLFLTLFVFEKIDDATKIQQLLANFDRDTCRPAQYYKYDQAIEAPTDSDYKVIKTPQDKSRRSSGGQQKPTSPAAPLPIIGAVGGRTTRDLKKKGPAGAQGKAQEPAAFISLREDSSGPKVSDAQSKTAQKNTEEEDDLQRRWVGSAKNQRYFYRVADTALPWKLVPKINPKSGREWALTPEKEERWEDTASSFEGIDYNETEHFVAVPNDGRLSPILWMFWESPKGGKPPPFIQRCMLAWKRVIHAENRRLKAEVDQLAAEKASKEAAEKQRKLEECAKKNDDNQGADCTESEKPKTDQVTAMRRFPWKMIVVNATNAKEFIPRGVLDSINIYAKPASARYSDLVRLALLQRYGGTYVDASSVPTTKDLRWQDTYFQGRRREQEITLNTDATEKKDAENKLKSRWNETEVFAFTRVVHNRDPSEDGEFAEMPVLESWFIAAAPKSQFMCLWLMEYQEMLALGHKAQIRKLTSPFSPLAKELPDGDEKEGGNDRGMPLNDQAYLSVYLAEDYVVQNYKRFPDTAYRTDGRSPVYLGQRLRSKTADPADPPTRTRTTRMNVLKDERQKQDQKQGDPMTFFRIEHTSSRDGPYKLYDAENKGGPTFEEGFLRSSVNPETGKPEPLPRFLIKFVDAGNRIKLRQMEKGSFAQRTLFPEGMPTPDDLERELNGTEGFSAEERAPKASDKSVFVGEDEE